MLAKVAICAASRCCCVKRSRFAPPLRNRGAGRISSRQPRCYRP